MNFGSILRFLYYVYRSFFYIFIMKKFDDIKSFFAQIKSRSIDEIVQKISSFPAADIVDFLLEFDDIEQLKNVFLAIEPEKKSKVFVEFTEQWQSSLLDVLEEEDIIVLFKSLPLDDTADLINSIVKNKELKGKILSGLNIRQKEKLSEILDLDEESAGGIMTPDFYALPASFTVEQACHVIKKSTIKDIISSIFVIVPGSKTLLGVVPLMKLVTAESTERLEHLSNKNYTYTHTDMDQEEVAQLFRKYNLLVMPVVNGKHQLIGQITVDDILDVNQEEAEEDLAVISGAPDLAMTQTSLLKVVLLRFPWLFLTLLLAISNSLVIKGLNFESSVVLVTFIPIIMAMGGNTGIQSATTFIREIALGNLSRKEMLVKAIREILSGFVLGCLCGLLASLLLFVFINLVSLNLQPYSMSFFVLLIFCSLVLTMTFSSFLGVFSTLSLHRLSIDPALAAGPFITTFNDISASVIYFLLVYVFSLYT